MRRRFPSLSTAQKMFGAENIRFFAPIYEKENQCPWCGGEVNNRRRRFCSDDCRRHFENVTVWFRGRDPYSLRIIYRDKFTCQDCGEFHAYVNEHGMTVPIDDGDLEVHHIIPVSDGGSDHPNNLVTLCKKCHIERHRKLREGAKVDKSTIYGEAHMNLDLTFSEEDVKESLEEVGIKLVPQSEVGKVKMTSEDGDTVYLDEDFSMFDSREKKEENNARTNEEML